MKKAKQINRLLTTFREYDKQTFKEMMMMAEARGITTTQYNKYGAEGALPDKPKWISESKRMNKKVNEFYKQISQAYAPSYTKYKVKKEKMYKRYKSRIDELNETGLNIKPLSYDQYLDFRNKRDELIDEIYSLIPSKENDIAEIVDYKEFNEKIRDISELDDESLVLAKLQEKLDDMQNQIERWEIDPNYQPEF